MRTMNSFRQAPVGILCSLVVLAAVASGCTGVKRPWRDYSQKPFSSTEWLAGDKIERGRMASTMYRNPAVEISSREVAIKTLGEPDLKKTIENKEVWFYRVDLGIFDALDLAAISFDEKGRGFVGYVHGGSISMMAKESEL